ncbi:hypothetical protein ACWEF6_06890 [Amycolatopsis sp. NPDC004772]
MRLRNGRLHSRHFTLAARLGSALPGIRFTVTASAVVRSAESPPTPGDVVFARRALRRHFREVLKKQEPADPDGACDELWANEVQADACPGLTIELEDVVVELDDSAREALDEFDAAERASSRRSRAVAARVDFVLELLAEPPRALAWLLGRDVQQLAPADLDKVLTYLEAVAERCKTPAAQDDAEVESDPLMSLLRVLANELSHPVPRAGLANSIADVFDQYDAPEIAQRARELVPPEFRGSSVNHSS